MLRSIYRGSSIDHGRLRNPVELWTAAGGRLNRKRQRRISSPAEVFSLRWEPIDLDRGILRVEVTKTGERLELPPIRQLATAVELHRYHADISRDLATRFWLHGLRNALITVAERDLMPPRLPPTECGLMNETSTTHAEPGVSVAHQQVPPCRGASRLRLPYWPQISEQTAPDLVLIGQSARRDAKAA